jgi:hypothetical protein
MEYISLQPFNMLGPSFWLFDDSDPADPFVPREWRQTIPESHQFGHTQEHFLQILGNRMDDTGTNRSLSHATIVANFWENNKKGHTRSPVFY